MKKARKLIFSILAAVMAFVMMSANFGTVQIKAENSSQAVLNAKNGVVEVNVNYVDSSGKPRLIQGGSGFLIGSGGSSGAQYVITNFHVANLDSDTETQAKAFFNTTELNTRIEVVVKGDVTVTAQILKQSEDADYAILKLDEVIYDRATLKLSKSADVKQTQNVYALGFPSVITYIEDTNYYTTEDVTITQGTITKLTTIGSFAYIQHSAKLSAGNSGGPLVDENGYVLGVNTYTDKRTSDYSFSLQIDEIINILDAFAIPYELAGGSSSTTTATTASSATNASTAASQEAPSTMAATQPSSSEAITTNGNVSAQNSDNTTLIIIIAAAAVILIIVIVIIVVMSGKKKKQAAEEQRRQQLMRERNSGASSSAGTVPNRQPYNGGRPTPPAPPVPPVQSGFDSGAGETSVLDNGSGETSVLGGGAAGQMPATLVRVKTGENISIRKSVFSLGKERNRVDYCITNNNSVSRTHANIVYKNGSYFIIDLNSTNNTFVNGQQLSPNQEVRLNVNDKIKLADEEFIFR